MNVLVTGSRGCVGTAIVPCLERDFTVYELDRRAPTGARSIRGDITDQQAVLDAVSRSQPQCIVHLAANASPRATEEELAGPNYHGFNNVYVAAMRYRVPRVIFASSLFTMSDYPGFPYRLPVGKKQLFLPTDPPRSTNPYGISKIWAEQRALRYYRRGGVRTVCLRLGDVNRANKPAKEWQFAPIWLSRRDAAQLFMLAIRAELTAPVAVYFALSGSDSPYSLQPTIDELGFKPADG